MNITGIIKKCLDELEKESPKLDYIRGMLETVVEVQQATIPSLTAPSVPATPVVGNIGNGSADFPAMDATARAAIEAAKLADQGL